MKRNLDLIREILLRIESNEQNATLSSSSFHDLNENKDLIDYHLYLLADAGYIEYLEVPIIGNYYPQIIVQWITNDGCDYLDSIRSPKIWVKTKEKLKDVGGQASFDVVKTIAEHLVMSMLGF